MDKTKDEILDNMRDNMPLDISDKAIPYIKEAMQIYADQEAKAYANWLSNEIIGGRTAKKLFQDYKDQVR